MKKLYISLIFSNLVVQNLLGQKIFVMHNFIAKFRKMLEICKQHVGNQVNEKGNVPRCGVIPTFSDLEAVALSSQRRHSVSTVGTIFLFILTVSVPMPFPISSLVGSTISAENWRDCLAKTSVNPSLKPLPAVSLSSALIPSRQRFVKMHVRKGVQWERGRRTRLQHGDIVHRKGCTTMATNSMPCAVPQA